MKNSFHLFFLTSSRIPGEKAESIAILKNIVELSKKCNTFLLITRRNNPYNISECDKFLLQKIKRIKLFSISLIHITKNIRFQQLFFRLLTITFGLSSVFFLTKNKIGSNDFLMTRESNLLHILLKFKKIHNYKIILELHQIPTQKNFIKLLPDFRKCYKILTISQYQKNKLIDYGLSEANIHCLRSGFDSSLFYPTIVPNFDIRKNLNINKNKKIVMYAGSLYGWKNIDFILKSVKFVNSKICCIILGGTEEQIIKLKREHETNEVEFIPRVSHDLVSQYLVQADVLVQYSSITKNDNLQSFSPIKIMEYLGMGKPILVSRTPWNEEIIQHKKNGLLYDPESPQELAEMIDKILNNKNLQKILRSNSIIDSKNYSYENRAKKLLELITKNGHNYDYTN